MVEFFFSRTADMLSELHDMCFPLDVKVQNVFRTTALNYTFGQLPLYVQSQK